MVYNISKYFYINTLLKITGLKSSLIVIECLNFTLHSTIHTVSQFFFFLVYEHLNSYGVYKTGLYTGNV